MIGSGLAAKLLENRWSGEMQSDLAVDDCTFILIANAESARLCLKANDNVVQTLFLDVRNRMIGTMKFGKYEYDRVAKLIEGHSSE